MSVIILTVDEVMRTLSSDDRYPFVVNDKEVDIVRFAINSGFADIVLDGQVALRVMYQRPGETEVRAQTLTYHDTDGLRNYYDWQLLSADLTKKGTLTVALCILRTDSELEEWHTTPCQIRVLDTIHTDDGDEADESITPTVAQRVAVLETMIQRVASGAPIVVSSASAMTDTEQIYVLSTDGNWYYHNGTAWVVGGTYGAVATDTTLTQSGVPADAKAAGDSLKDLKSALKDEWTTIKKHIYTRAESIAAVNGYRIKQDGKTEASANWCCLLAPVATVFVDGLMTIQRSGISGLGDTIFSLGYFDENMTLISARYDTIPANTVISLADIPANALYIGANKYTTDESYFVIPCNSIDTRIRHIEGLSADIQIVGIVTKRSDNLFNRLAYDLVALTTGGTVVQNNNVRSVIIPITVTDQTAITVTRTVMSSRFTIATFTDEPVVGSSSITYRVDNASESLTIPVTSEAKYLMVYFWLSSADTLTPEEILDGLMVEFGTEFTGYEEPYVLKISESDKQDIVANVQSQVNTVRDATTEDDTEIVELTFTSADGYYASNKLYTTYSGVTVAAVPVTAGDRYRLTTRRYGNAALACFLDSNDTVTGVVFSSDVSGAITNLPITIPAGTVNMLIQRFYDYSPTVLKKVVSIRIKQIDSILNGKRVTVIGDSITEVNSTAYPNWSLYMGDWCGALVQNLGASGTGFIAGNNNPYHNRINRIDTPDIIGVALSFNDMRQTIEDLTTAAETFFDDLITAYPTTPIICYVQSPWSAYHPGIEASDNWVAALRTICNTRGVPFYDGMYYGSALKPWLHDNRLVYYMHDGEGNTPEEDWVHPNSEGHKVIARHLYPHFAENVVATGLDYLI